MTLHCKLKPDGAEQGVSLGTVEMWADDCETDAEKVIAQFIATIITQSLNAVGNIGKYLFDPPADEHKSDAEKGAEVAT